MKHRPPFACLVLFLACSFASAASAAPAKPRVEGPPAPVVDSVRVGPYTIRVLGSDEQAQWCRITRGSKLVLELPPDGRLRIGGYWRDTTRVAPGTDVNADGQPDVTLWSWSGGQHCCYATTIVTLGDTVGVLQRLETADFALRLRNLDKDPALEAQTLDPVFAYWPGGFARSPAPPVSLDWFGGQLRASCELTLHAVNADSLMDEADRLKRELDWTQGLPARPASDLMSAVVAALYTGEDALAFKMFERARPDTYREYIDQLLVELGTYLQRSKYWPDLAPCIDKTKKPGHGAGH